MITEGASDLGQGGDEIVWFWQGHGRGRNCSGVDGAVSGVVPKVSGRMER